jgi:hypothetical protein
MSDNFEDKDQSSATSPGIRIIEVVLALALLGTLIFAGWRVYHSLPSAAAGTRTETSAAAAQSDLTITLRNAGFGTETRIELYPIDFAAARENFVLLGRPGKSFEDFLVQKLEKLTPVRAEIDQGGRAQARLAAGNWWLRATSASQNDEMLEWRMPLVISQRAQTVELSADNAYERTKKF